MDDRELLKKTLKTVGAMVLGTVLLLGTLGVFVSFVVGHAVGAPTTMEAPSTAGAKNELVPGLNSPQQTTVPPAPKTQRRATASVRTGESI
jgi:hypothetical protein